MDISMASLKGGVGKTTSAIHIAACLSKHGTTALVDSDKNESALVWARKGLLPFGVYPMDGAIKHTRNAEHIVIDTAARPSPADIEAIADGCDLLILPTTPKALDLDALIRIADMLAALETDFKVLLTITPSPRRSAGSSKPVPSLKEREARELLEQAEIPAFKSAIYQYTVFERAPLEGVVVSDYSDKYAQTAMRCYQLVMEEIFDEHAKTVK